MGCCDLRMARWRVVVTLGWPGDDCSDGGPVAVHRHGPPLPEGGRGGQFYVLVSLGQDGTLRVRDLIWEAEAGN